MDKTGTSCTVIAQAQKDKHDKWLLIHRSPTFEALAIYV